MIYYQGKNVAETRVSAVAWLGAMSSSLVGISMVGNRVVIKINYDKDKHRKALIDPKMVTVWHTNRILAAIAILCLLVLLVFFGFSAEEPIEYKQQASEDLNTVVEVVEQEPVVITPVIKSLPSKTVVVDITAANSKRPSAIIFDKRVIRASLNAAIRNNEPVEPIKSPLVIDSSQVVELFYFSEIKSMPGKVLFHHWFKNNRLIYKKQLEIQANKSKLISSKKLTAKDSGEWRVALIDKKGKLFSEVNFLVNLK